jgi:hypothetical protein
MKEALKRALDALEYWDVHGGLHQPTEEAITALRLAIDVQNMASESTYKAALAQQETVFFGVKDQGLVKVSSLEFVTRVMGKEEVIGKPIFWAEWPSKEPK